MECREVERGGTLGQRMECREVERGGATGTEDGERGNTGTEDGV